MWLQMIVSTNMFYHKDVLPESVSFDSIMRSATMLPPYLSRDRHKSPHVTVPRIFKTMTEKVSATKWDNLGVNVLEIFSRRLWSMRQFSSPSSVRFSHSPHFFITNDSLSQPLSHSVWASGTEVDSMSRSILHIRPTGNNTHRPHQRTRKNLGIYRMKILGR